MQSLPIQGQNARFDHVALAAPRIRDLLPLYGDLLGGRFVSGGDNPRVGYRAVQLGFPAGRKVELLEPLPGSTFLDRFFERTGGGGLHHVTFMVDDVRAAIAELERIGITPTNPFLDNPAWAEVFIHPKESGGVLIQMVQSDGSGGSGRHTLEDVLAGRGPYGTGTASP